MNPTIVIPTYWADGRSDAHDAAAYDHATPLSSSAPDLDACLTSLEQVRDAPRIIVLAVCALSATGDVTLRLERMIAEHPALRVTLVTNVEAARIIDRVCAIAPMVQGETVSLRGYGAIRNMGLAAAAILGHDAVVFLDDDEQVRGPDFMERALYGLGQETRQRLPILAKSGYFYDRNDSPLADTSRSGLTNRWWTKRIEFNRWMRRALEGTRISRSNYVCGGCLALHARAFKRVAFDPYITRGENLDYLFNLRLQGLDVWFDNTWAVRHLPPAVEHRAPRFMQDVYRWFYERTKLAYASRQKDLVAVTPTSLMPYPGPWFSAQLDERVRKTAFVRALFTSEHAAYWRIWRRGCADAAAYAEQHEVSYLRFQSFWPSIMDGLWRDERLAAMLEGR